MEVHCDEGVANRIGPKPCAGICEGVGEASAGDHAGQPLSRDGVLYLGADVVPLTEGNTEGRDNRQLHVVAGRVDSDGKLGCHFACLATESVALCHMKALLEDQGCHGDSMVAVLADGADGLGGIVRHATMQAPRTILDGFHISMRLRHIEQMGPWMRDLFPGEEALGKIPRLRCKMWNGQWQHAIYRMRDCYRGTSIATTTVTAFHAERVKRFRKHLIDLRDYLLNNQKNLMNYGKARRDGLRISSAPAESGMNHLVNQRMGKRQPMRWSANGAHLLLQVRCAMLDRRLETLFREWFPRFRSIPPITPARAA